MLATYKRFYIGQIDARPTRGLQIFRNPRQIAKVTSNVVDLIFLEARAPTNDRSIDLNLIDVSLQNFNVIVDMIELRDRLFTSLLERAKSAPFDGQGFVQRLKELDELVGVADVNELVGLTEHLLENLDSLMENLHQSMNSLCKLSASRIDS